MARRLSFWGKQAIAALWAYPTVSLAEEWRDKARREGRAEVTLGKLKWQLELAHPIIAARKIGEIKAAELLAVLRAVDKRGYYETARRLPRHGQHVAERAGPLEP